MHSSDHIKGYLAGKGGGEHLWGKHCYVHREGEIAAAIEDTGRQKSFQIQPYNTNRLNIVQGQVIELVDSNVWIARTCSMDNTKKNSQNLFICTSTGVGTN